MFEPMDVSGKTGSHMYQFRLLGVAILWIVVTGSGCTNSSPATCDNDEDCFQNEECRDGTCLPGDADDAGTQGPPDDVHDSNDATDSAEPDVDDDVRPHACVRSCINVRDCPRRDAVCDDNFCWTVECVADTDCRQGVDYWGPDCATDDDCNSLERCVDVGSDDEGLCAREIIGTEVCSGDGSVPYEQETFEDGETITVCGAREGYCNDSGERSHCETEQQITGQECTTDSDCSNVFSADTCYDGVCGCSETDFCQNALGSSYSCVQRS